MATITSISHDGFGAPDTCYSAGSVTVFNGEVGSGKSTALMVPHLAMTGEISGGPKRLGEIVRQYARSRSQKSLRASIGIATESGTAIIDRSMGETEAVQLTPILRGKSTKSAVNQAIVERFYGPPLSADLAEFMASPEKTKARLLDMLGQSAEIDLQAAIEDAIPIACDSELWGEVRASAVALAIKYPRQNQPLSDWVAQLEEQSNRELLASRRQRRDTEAAMRGAEITESDVSRISQTIADQQCALNKLRERLAQENREFGEQQERHKRLAEKNKRLDKINAAMDAIRFPPRWNETEAQKQYDRMVALSEKFSKALDSVELALCAQDDAQRAKTGAEKDLANARIKWQDEIEFCRNAVKSKRNNVHRCQSELREVECPECKHQFTFADDAMHLEDAKRDLSIAMKQADAKERGKPQYVIDVETAETEARDALRIATIAVESAASAAKSIGPEIDLILGEWKSDDDHCPPDAENAIEYYKRLLSQRDVRAGLAKEKMETSREISGLGATVSLVEQEALIASIHAKISEAESALKASRAELGAAEKHIAQRCAVTELLESEAVWSGLHNTLQIVRTEIVRKSFAPLTTNINALVGKVLPGEVTLNERGEFIYQDGDTWRPWSACSDGERAFIGIAVAGAITSLRPLNALRCITIDNVERVGQERMIDVVRIAAEIWEALHVQVILAGHFDRDQLDEPWIVANNDIDVHKLLRADELVEVA